MEVLNHGDQIYILSEQTILGAQHGDHIVEEERPPEARGLVGCVVALLLCMPGSAIADEPCQGKRALDPRNARLQVLDLQVGQQGVLGRVRNGGGETALGVMVWVNYYLSRRGGLTAQQCIAVGDLRPGEERPFAGGPPAEAARTEAFDYAVDAVGWR